MCLSKFGSSLAQNKIEPVHDKTNKMTCAPSEYSDQPGHPLSLIRVFTVRMKTLGSLATYWAHSKGSDQTKRMPRLICVFAGRTGHLLALSRGCSFYYWIFKGKVNMSHLMTKSTKWLVHPAKTQSSLCDSWEANDPVLLHTDSEDSVQTGWIPRLIWV